MFESGPCCHHFFRGSIYILKPLWATTPLILGLPSPGTWMNQTEPIGGPSYGVHNKIEGITWTIPGRRSDKFWYVLILQILMFETWKKIKSDKNRYLLTLFILIWFTIQKRRGKIQTGDKKCPPRFVCKRFLYSLPTLVDDIFF